MLWALGDERVATIVRDAHDRAVDAAIAYLDANACVIRRGKEGRLRLPGDGLIAAGFRHRTSREVDPQLHTHVLVANLTRGPDDRWSSLFGTMLYRLRRGSGGAGGALGGEGIERDLQVLEDVTGSAARGVRHGRCRAGSTSA